jgi:translation initiation factor 1A
MPKKDKARKNAKNRAVNETRQLLLKGEEQEYAQIIKRYGDGRMQCFCFDGMERMGVVRGSLKRCKFTEGDYVIISLRDFQDDKADIMYKYDQAEVARLQRMGEIPKDTDDGPSIGITFGGDEEEELINFSDI